MRFLCVVSSLAVASLAVAVGDDTKSLSTATAEVEKEILRLTELWSGWRERTKTFKVEGFRFIGLCSSLETAVSRDEIRNLFADVLVPWQHAHIAAADSITLEVLNELPIGNLFPRLPVGSLKYDRVGTGWSHFELLSGPDGSRVDHETNVEKKTIIRRDGKEQSYSSGTKQATLLPFEGKERVEALADVLYMPNLKPLTRLEIIAPERHVLTNSSADHEFKIEFNPSNGFVYHDVRGLTGKGYLLERIQDFPFEGGSSPPVPRLMIKMSYQSAASGSTFLRSVSFYLFTKVAFNSDYSSRDLRLAVPAGTVIADFEHQIPSTNSKTGMGPIAHRIAEPTDDALQTANEEGFQVAVTTPAAAPSPPQKNGLGIARLLLIIGNAILLVGCLVWWKRNAKQPGDR